MGKQSHDKIFMGWGCQPNSQPAGPGHHICDPNPLRDKVTQLYLQALGAQFSRFLRRT
jgi:hypothetical protein